MAPVVGHDLLRGEPGGPTGASSGALTWKSVPRDSAHLTGVRTRECGNGSEAAHQIMPPTIYLPAGRTYGSEAGRARPWRVDGNRGGSGRPRTCNRRIMSPFPAVYGVLANVILAGQVGCAVRRCRPVLRMVRGGMANGMTGAGSLYRLPRR